MTKLSYKVGRLDYERYHKIKREEGLELRVLLDGEDVTERCREADDIEGWVMIWTEGPLVAMTRIEFAECVRRDGCVEYAVA